MSTEEEEIIPISEKLGYTQSKIIRFNYTWEIAGFNDEAHYKSPIFSPGYNGKLKCYLYFCSYYGKDICLYFLSCDMSEMTVNYQASLRNANGQAVHTTKERPICKSVPTEQVTEYKINWPTNDFISAISNGVLPFKKLTIFCEIVIILNTLNITANTSVIEVPEYQLDDDIRKLLETQKFSDVTIIICGQELPAHKAILSVRSRVFSAMFEHDMAEKELNRVNVTDVELEVFKEMLLYIYTDQAPNIITMADKLLAAAEKYELERLKIMCQKTLVANLTIRNVVDNLILAELHHADQLKAQAIDFISLNAVEMMETESFQSMFHSHPYLIADVLRALAMRQSSMPDKSMLNFI